MKSVFKKIIDGELPCKTVYEDDKIIAFHDIAPQAPIHILIMPKKEIPDLQSLKPEDYPLLGEVVRVAQEVAAKLGIAKGYRLVTNSGPGAGQTVFHLHFHLMGGRRLSDDMA